MEARSVLVLSADALAAALLGVLVELEGYTLHFARGGEAPREALRRIRAATALVDCDLPGGCTAAFIGPAKMMGVRVVLFGRPAVSPIVAACAEQFAVPVLRMPPGPGELGRLLAGSDDS